MSPPVTSIPSNDGFRRGANGVERESRLVSGALHHRYPKDQTLPSTTRKALDARLLLKSCKLAYRVLEKGRRSFVHTPECDERAPRLGRENHQDVQYWRYIDCRGGVRAELLRSPGPR